MGEINVNGVKLVYEIHGEGPSIALVCGTGQPSATWAMFGMLGALTDAGYQVVTFDNRGIPPSDVPPGPYTVEEMASDAIAVLEHVGNGPYVVLGASLGGLITQTVALTRPELVRAAVFMVGCGNVSAYARAQMRGYQHVFALADPPADLLAAMALPSFVPPTRWADEVAVDAALAIAGMFTASSLDGFRAQLQADVKWAEENHLDELSGLQVPALAIAHEYDMGFPPACVKQAVERMPQGEYVEVPGVAHVSLDPADTEIVTSALRDFLARHAPVTTPV